MTSFVNIPPLVLGTFKLQGDTCYKIVLHAIKNKLYNAIDTASCYHNQIEIGRAIKDSNIPRNEIYIISKIAPREMGLKDTLNATNKILEELQTDYIDLMLIHWPGKSRIKANSDKHNILRLETWKVLENLKNKGICKAIGVSNFTENHLENLLSECDVIPSVNQVEFHPHLIQDSLKVYCDSKNIFLSGYASLGNGKLLNDDVICKIANFYNKTSPQILIRWSIQRGVGSIVKASSVERIEENSNVFDFELSSQHMEEINSLHCNSRYCWDPSAIK